MNLSSQTYQPNDIYVADVVSYSDYYPFGMQMPGRNGNSGDYRYGFNGAESDNEVYGEKNSYDLGLRMYNPRIGRMFSIDPRAPEYPWQSPYAYHRNNPIAFIDYLGGGDPPKHDHDPEADPEQVKSEMGSWFNIAMSKVPESSNFLDMACSAQNGELDYDNPQEYEFGFAYSKYIEKASHLNYLSEQAGGEKIYGGNENGIEIGVVEPFKKIMINLALEQGYSNSNYESGYLRIDRTLRLSAQVYRIDLAVNHLTKRGLVNSIGRCSQYVRQAIEAGGVSTEGRPVSAYKYKEFLPVLGFKQVSAQNYKPKYGDIYVMSNSAKHVHGHIAMWNGKQWISDFKQRNIQVYRDNRNMPVTFWRR